jgi:Aromatic-ring-opening dioxygenase LigAB, LigA subunit
MSKRLTEFLIQLSTDPRQAERFETDPAETMNAAGLSEQERQAVLSRNPDAIRRELGQMHVSTLTDDKGKRPKKKKTGKKPTKKK